MKTYPYRPISMTQILSWGLAAVLLNAGVSWAGFTPPANLSRPGNREGAATRGACKVETSATEPDLTTLVPVTNIGLTTANRPTFYWYLPANNYQAMEFTLFQSRPDGGQVEIYSQKLPLAGRPRLDSLTLDGKVPPLMEGVDYRWTVSLICNPADPDPSQIRFVEGWVQRVPMPEALAKQLSKATPVEAYELLAANGLWYDALNVLVNLRQQQPNDTKTATLWTELMTSDSVGLNRLSNPLMVQRLQPN
jgi:hypothetical protein